jgi:hypothetical protein
LAGVDTSSTISPLKQHKLESLFASGYEYKITFYRNEVELDVFGDYCET